MRKKMKRMWALMIASMMIVLSCMTVMAKGTGTTPSSEDKATITVTNVKEGATVTAYKIVGANYTENGFTGYEAVDAVKTMITNINAPTAEDIFNISKQLGSLGLETVSLTGTDGIYTAYVEAGEYIVIVSGAGDVVYNPMLISAFYKVDGSGITGGTVSAKDNWTLDGGTTVAKSSEPDIDKKVLEADGNDNGSSAAVGDEVKYQITATIPSYSAQYETVTYKISDTMSDGLTPNENAEVKIGDETVSEPDVTISYVDQTMTIEFTSAYILAHGGQTVTVTYSGTLNEQALVNMDKNNNTATVQYSNDPTDTSSFAEKQDTTYTYTFALDGNVNGSQTTVNKKTHEIIKVDENGNATDQTFDETTTDESTVTNALEGAEFTLTNKTTGKSYTATTNENGYFDGFTGLDAGTYTLVETKAPAGYSLDTTEHTVEISAEYNKDGTLQSYTITIDGEATSTYTATYDADKTITNIEGSSSTTYIQNTKLGQLPSTGGMGTYLFTLIGVAIMVFACVLYFRRQKQA